MARITKKQRRQLLATIAEAEAEFSRNFMAEAADDEVEDQRAYDAALGALGALYDQYEATLIRTAMSRCPISGEVIMLTIDKTGMDGPWWSSERPIRPAETLPETVYAWTGAAELPGPLPEPDFVIRPGPGVPFVVPRIAMMDRMKMVLSSLKVGSATAYVIFYFHPDSPDGLARINHWGQNHYMVHDEDGQIFPLNVADQTLDFDFDIQRYIDDGKLLWIAPGDRKLRLQSTSYDCPYLACEGHQFPVRIVDGMVFNSLADQPAALDLNQLKGGAAFD